VAVTVFTHEAGTRGDESYIISTLEDLIASIAWGEKSLGQFAGIVPVWDGCPVNPYRQVVWSFSPKGSGNAYECRCELKRLLPRKMHRWIGEARRANRRRKYDYLGCYRPFPGLDASAEAVQEHETWLKAARRDRALQPAEFREMRLGELWLKWDVPPEVRAEMARYMVSGDPFDFWRVATGRVKSVEVKDLVVYQLEMELSDAN
jgi:hypothetical protein